MRYQLYKLIHIVGIMAVFTGLAGLLWTRMVGVKDNRRANRAAASFHGVGLVLLAVSGFGMLPTWMGNGFPTWAMVKIALWLALGAAITLAGRKGAIGWPLAIAFLAFGAASAYLGLFKPI